MSKRTIAILAWIAVITVATVAALILVRPMIFMPKVDATLFAFIVTMVMTIGVMNLGVGVMLMHKDSPNEGKE